MALALAAAVCGSSTSTSTGASTPAAATTPSTAPTQTVGAATLPSLGAVLVNGSGRTLYLFLPDKQKAVTCTAACAQAWPPLVLATGAPTAGPGIHTSLLGTIKDPDGQTQVTYNHWPLYTFAGDSAPNQDKGQGIEGTWFAVTTTGVKAPAKTPTSAATAATIAATSTAPATTAPVTTAPATTAPAITAPAVTAPAVTAPMVTVPVVTAPPPTTAAPITAPPTTAPPVTAPPTTAPPVTAPPTTQPPGGPAY